MFINIVGNFICYMYECSYWSHLFHHDLLCNACIDFSKMMKDYQFMLYGTATPTVALKFNNIISDYSSNKSI